jgi:hypothetical protein
MKDMDQILTNSDIDETLMKQGVCHSVALSFTLNPILKAKEELWKLKHFTMQKYNLQEILE